MSFFERHIYEVSELTREIKSLLESGFPDVWVRGEVSNLRTSILGHTYFTLKDQESQINVVLFKSYASQIDFDLKDGMGLLVYGSVSVYEKRGEYQLKAFWARPFGIGMITVALEQLKMKLAQEGLFDPSRKRKLPAFPRRIGVVTSPTGAAIRDIITVSSRRFPGVRILLAPVLVQGEEAPPLIIKAIEDLNRVEDVDVIIVARGGGSAEDLWAFNDERVARAVASSRVPVISAVGHEIDVTIVDLVADLRAATPSQAAEIATASISELSGKISELRTRMKAVISDLLSSYKLRLTSISSSRAMTRPKEILNEYKQRIDDILEGMRGSMRDIIEVRRRELAEISGKLNALNPSLVLSRGYSITTFPDGRIITDHSQVSKGDEIHIRLKKGKLICEVKEKIDEKEFG